MNGHGDPAERTSLGPLMWWLLALTRGGVFAQALLLLSTDWRASSNQGFVALLLAVLGATAVAVLVLHRRSGPAARAAVVLDLCVTMAAFVLVGVVSGPSAHAGAKTVTCLYGVAAVSTLGVTLRRLPWVLSLAGAVACCRVVTVAGWSGYRSGTTVLDSLCGYETWAVVGWSAANRFRAVSAALDLSCRRAVDRERERAEERERVRISRALHDRVLQTLEFLGGDRWISDRSVRDHVAAEALWLRELIRGELGPRTPRLAGALDEMVTRQTDAGLRVDLNTAGLGDDALPRVAIQGLTEATGELLTNVRKHSGTTRAVVRAVSSPTHVMITVLDHGCGFAPERVGGGIGLRESVVARIRQLGGDVVVTSEPGLGTHVELSLPLPHVTSQGSCSPPLATRSTRQRTAALPRLRSMVVPRTRDMPSRGSGGEDGPVGPRLVPRRRVAARRRWLSRPVMLRSMLGNRRAVAERLGAENLVMTSRTTAGRGALD